MSSSKTTSRAKKKTESSDSARKLIEEARWTKKTHLLSDIWSLESQVQDFYERAKRGALSRGLKHCSQAYDGTSKEKLKSVIEEGDYTDSCGTLALNLRALADELDTFRTKMEKKGGK